MRIISMDLLRNILATVICMTGKTIKYRQLSVLIRDTELGRAAEVTGRDIAFDYTGGWAAFLDTLQLGMILGSILILIGVSPVFAEERQIKTSALLMTSTEGKEKDVRAKTAAAFTLRQF